MKKNLTLLLYLVVSTCTFAQDVVKPSSIGFSFALTDFETPAQIYATSLKDVIKSGDFAKITKRMNTAFTIQYLKGITSNIDFAATYTGSFLTNPPAVYTESNVKYFQSIDAAVNVKLLKETAVVNPYISAGISGYNFDNKWGIKVPLGLGLQFRPTEDVSVLLQGLYKSTVQDNGYYHIVYSLGVAVPIVKPKEPKIAAPPPPPPPPPVVPVVVAPKPVDTDGDGITDNVDKCPSVAGLAKYNGCPIPDTDGDGVNDETDKCPTVAGFARYGGCPIPDTDGDGVNDEMDKCPTVAGLARYGGCPIPDTDGDGVNDEMDKCPNDAGPADNAGCPKLEQYNFNAKNVQFVTGSSMLTAAAKKELDKAVTILKDHSELRIAIEGYTDNTGTTALNQKLSQKRADAVKAYLTGNGISADRLTSTGFGVANPVADNKTAAGRAQNRRVEFKRAE